MKFIKIIFILCITEIKLLKISSSKDEQLNNTLTASHNDILIHNINALGMEVNQPIIESPPYKIMRCDQVVFIKGSRLHDYNDYTDRKDAFFEIGIYVINIFNSFAKDKLIDTIHNTHIMDVPMIIPGTGNCLDIFDKNINKRFSMCLENSEIINDIQKVFFDFIRCRKGDNLQKSAKEFIEQCQKENKKNGFLMENSDNQEQKNKYYNYNKVPGS
jgi:hypothetical protein